MFLYVIKTTDTVLGDIMIISGKINAQNIIYRTSNISLYGAQNKTSVWAYADFVTQVGALTSGRLKNF